MGSPTLLSEAGAGAAVKCLFHLMNEETELAQDGVQAQGAEISVLLATNQVCKLGPHLLLPLALCLPHMFSQLSAA